MRLLASTSALLLLAASPAFATVTKTWVSSTGNDTGTCQLDAPCKTLQFAHNQTSPGGEIDVKDTGSYGQLVITKAVSVVSGDGALAAVGAPSSGVGITINAGSNDAVLLEGLFIDGHGVGNDGIYFNSGRSITVQNCHIRNLASSGVTIAASSAAVVFSIVNTEISGVAQAAIAFQGNVNNSPKGTVSRAFVHDNNTGIFTGHAYVLVVNSTIANNQTGVAVNYGSSTYLGGSTVSGSSTQGVSFGPAATQSALSFGNNHFNGNASDVGGGGTIPTTPTQ